MIETRRIDGRALAARLRADIAEEIKDAGLAPGLAAILIGDDPASHIYVSLKEKACAEVGIRFEKLLLPATIAQAALEDAIRGLNARTDVDAILLQLPLPPALDADAAISAILPGKDADGFHPANLDAYRDGRGPAPVLVEAILALLDEAGAAPVRAAVIGNSPVFLEPTALALERRGLAVSSESDLARAEAAAREADLVVVALGRPGWLDAAKIRPGATVIDVGTTKVGEAIVGDAGPDLEGVAAALTPVPGGVGPMTVACLLRRVLELARDHSKK